MRLYAARASKTTVVAAVTTAVLAVPATGSATAAAHPSAKVSATSVSSTCKHHSRKHIVATYHRGSARYTLRCGTTKWGWKHIKKRHGWNAGMNKRIKAAIAHGANNGRGGFSSYTNQCPPIEKFRTILGTPAGKRDLLTAYKVHASAAAKCEKPVR